MKPLAGRNILITRKADQSADFKLQLEQLGATVIALPTIEIMATPSRKLDQAIENITDYDWLIFTSANAVTIFCERVEKLNPNIVLPPVCAIGPATAEQVHSRGFEVALLPQVFQAEGVLEAFRERLGESLEDMTFLLPRARQARQILPETLRRCGGRVDVIPIYETRAPESSRLRLQEVLGSNTVDLVVFTSSSTVKNFLSLAGDVPCLEKVRCAAIGPITSQTAREAGLSVVVEPTQSTIPALVEAIGTYFDNLQVRLRPAT